MNISVDNFLWLFEKIKNKIRRKVYLSSLFLEKIKLKKYLDDNLHELFNGKTVALVGPADSALKEENGKYIDEFDLIVRMNKGYQLIHTKKMCDALGSRTDILFNKCRISEFNNSNADINLLQKQRLKYFIGYNRIGNWDDKKVIRFILKFENCVNNYFKILSRNKYQEIVEYLDGNKPSVGFIALYTITNSNFKKLYITGMTFFKTEYIDGYREGVTSDDQISRFKEKDGHNPEKEYEKFVEIYKKNKHKIELDYFLRNIL